MEYKAEDCESFGRHRKTGKPVCNWGGVVENLGLAERYAPVEIESERRTLDDMIRSTSGEKNAYVLDKSECYFALPSEGICNICMYHTSRQEDLRKIIESSKDSRNYVSKMVDSFDIEV